MILRLAPAGRRTGSTRSGSVRERARAGLRGWITKDRTAPGHIAIPAPPRLRKARRYSVFTDDVVAFLERVLRWDGKSWNA